MGEFRRKNVSRQLIALSEGEIAALTTAMRQLGVGPQGGAEARHLSSARSRCVSRRITDRTACQNQSRTTKNCFGVSEWKAVREAASRFLPKHTAAAVWKHRNLSDVEQEEVLPMPKGGAEQGDVDRPLEVQPSSGNGGG